MVLLHGFGLSPRTYRKTAVELAERAGVLVAAPWLFAVDGPWSHERATAALVAMLDAHGWDRVSLVGHSFGGGLQLELAARHPGRVAELVFVDTLALTHSWGLAHEALRPTTFLRLASAPALASFARSAASHPLQLARAAWWGFVSDRDGHAQAVRQARIPAHVLWAERDTLLSRRDGRAFANTLGATFTVARAGAGRGPIDHDWMYRHPGLFVDHLCEVGLAVTDGRCAASS